MPQLGDRPDRRTDVHRRRAEDAAQSQAGVLEVSQVRELGIPWWFVRAEVRLGRWRRGRRTVILHNGPLPRQAELWRAVLEAGPRAMLDGISVLQDVGLDVEGDGLIHVIVPRGANAPDQVGVVIHESRRHDEADLAPGARRQTRLPVAAVHAALWARTDREAAFFLTLVVQQDRTRPTDLFDVLVRVRRHRRRRHLHSVVEELAGGVRSLGELDIARGMRSRGLPEPDRQVIRVRASGVEYLDAEFDAYELVLEVDGAQHRLPQQQLKDNLRDLAETAGGKTVLRVTLVAWNLDEQAVLDHLEMVFTSRGWRRPAA